MLPNFPIHKGDRLGIRNIDPGALVHWALKNAAGKVGTITVVAHDSALYDRLKKECIGYSNLRVYNLWHMATITAKTHGLGRRVQISDKKYKASARKLLNHDRRPLAIDQDKDASAERLMRHCYSVRMANADPSSHDSMRASVEWDGEEFAREDLLAVQELLLDGEADTLNSLYLDFVDFPWFLARKCIVAKNLPDMLIVPNVHAMSGLQVEIVKLYTGNNTRLILGTNGIDQSGVCFAPRELPPVDWHTANSYAPPSWVEASLGEFVKSDSPAKIVVAPSWRVLDVASRAMEAGASVSIRGDGLGSDVQSLLSRFTLGSPKCHEDWTDAVDVWAQSQAARAKARKAKPIAFQVVEKNRQLLTSAQAFGIDVLSRRLAVNALWKPGGQVTICTPKRLDQNSVRKLFVAHRDEMRENELAYIAEQATGVIEHEP